MTFSDAVPTEAIERYLEHAISERDEALHWAEYYEGQVRNFRAHAEGRIKEIANYEAALESRRHGNG